MELPLFELIINEEDESGVDFIALVDKPAIKRNWIAFNEEEFASFTDYPEKAKENAKTALRYAEENGWGDCGTSVGKIRANQLANGEAISRETIARMAAFERHRQNSQKELGDGCGRLMWLAWGGDEGIEWAQRKIKEIDKKFNDFKFKSDSEKRIISGPAMIPDEPIYRRDKEGNEYNVIFRKDTIQKIVEKYFKQQNTTNFNLQHKKTLLAQGVYLIESFLIDEERGIKAPNGFEDLPNGSWFISCKVDNDEIWNDFVKEGVFRGFSVEGLFMEKEVKPEQDEFRELNEMLDKLQLKNKLIIKDMTEAKTLLSKLKEIFSDEEKPNEVVMSEAKLADGITIVKWDGELAEGTAVSVVSEEGEIPAPDGDHELQDGRKITIEGGKVTKIETAPEQKEDEEKEGEVEINMEQAFKMFKENFAVGSAEERIAMLETLVKVLFKDRFDWQIREQETKADMDAAMSLYKSKFEEAEATAKQLSDKLSEQKAAFKMMFEVVEKLADQPSGEGNKPNTFNINLTEQKKEEFNRLEEVINFLNK